MTATAVAQTVRRKKPRRALREGTQISAKSGFLFVLPMFLVFCVFSFLPFFAGIGLSFTRINLGGQIRFEGLGNYERLLSDTLFWHSLAVTGVFTLIAVPLTIAGATAVALLVRRPMRGVRVARAIFFLPVITSLVLASIVFVWLFNTGGPIAQLSGWLGLGAESWLAHPIKAIAALAIVAAWANFGFDMLIILARFQDIPRELDEAAMLDGATAWQRFRHVTAPQMRGVYSFLIIIETIGSFKVFDLVYVMTKGGPVNATYTTTYMLYDNAFNFSDFSYAATIGVALFVVILTLTGLLRALLRDES